ncbi:long-chain-fatty-acid--CoA ligase heimdall [Stomoxys calcitrans]|uniref:long-chain-fatty-acid--CoA ligase heimdall n=1 Tax=Stomoxys calcitrans TaxID=35570 RepID=UPI0027E2B904|nr:long-chain-fatty-acid--CoA ligase heimdall [Stomoxys calcitrans]
MEMARTAMMQHYLSDAKGKPTLSYCLYSYLVKQCKINLGLDRVKSCFIGGAPVSRELKLFFSCIATPLNECFGLSESSGIVFYNFQRNLSNAAGKPIGDIEVKIRKINDSEQGEVLMRGRMNFMGYLKDPEKTRETLTKDGWIHTGDLGLLDANGNLVITGRIKELIITAGGENMPPNYIEALIKKELPCLSNAIAIGDRRKYITALLTFKTLTDLDTGLPLDTLLPETLDWLASLGLHYSSLSEMLHIHLPENLRDFDPNGVQVKIDEKLEKALEMGVKRANQLAISNAQRVQYFSVLPHDFSIPTGEIGPTLKSRRQFIEKKYAPIIDKMYKK